MKFLLRSALIGAVALSAAPIYAATTAQMNLERMVNGAERVFVGRVVDISESRIEFGGGQIPAVTYKFKVSEAFKGDYQTIKGERFAEVKMVGTLKQVLSGHHPINDFPVLGRNQDYLLMVAPAGPIGLTATMGLAQGCFHVNGTESDKVVLNGVNNVGLFSGMNVGIADGIAVSYTSLSAMIRDIVGGAQ